MGMCFWFLWSVCALWLNRACSVEGRTGAVDGMTCAVDGTTGAVDGMTGAVDGKSRDIVVLS